MDIREIIKEFIIEAVKADVDEMSGVGSVGAFGFGFPLGADPHPGRNKPLYGAKPKSKKKRNRRKN